jgi:hypothetical protein
VSSGTDYCLGLIGKSLRQAISVRNSLVNDLVSRTARILVLRNAVPSNCAKEHNANILHDIAFF